MYVMLLRELWVVTGYMQGICDALFVAMIWNKPGLFIGLCILILAFRVYATMEEFTDTLWCGSIWSLWILDTHFLYT